MKRHIPLWILGWLIAFPTFSVQVSDGAGGTTITTALYEVFWSKTNTMGFATAKVPGLKKPLMAGDAKMYMDLDYRGGRRAWGDVNKKTDIVETPKGAVVTYISHDDTDLQYTAVVKFWDAVPFIRLDVTATVDKGAEPVTWPATGYEPILIPGIDVKWDNANKVGNMQRWKEPLPHIAYWTDDGFGALYATSPDAAARFGDWRGDGAVIRLDHGALGINIKPTKNHTISYYVAFAAGGADKAHELASEILANAPVDPRAVEPKGKVATSWGELKSF